MSSYPSGWYAVIDSREIKKKKALAKKLFGKNFVFWRNNDGKVIAMLDLCPHRSAQLSLGEVKNNCIACPFHGFQFDEQGVCQHAPEFKTALPSLKVQTFPCEEKNHFLWIWWGEGTPKIPPPWPEEVTQNFKFSQLVTTWNSDITRCIENQLDYTHLPFVHRTTIGRGFQLDEKKVVKNLENKIQIFLHGEEGNQKPGIEFYFNNVWQNRISNKFSLILAFVPLEEGKTQLYLRSYQSFVTLSFLQPFISFVLNIVNRVILNQDKLVVASQGKIPSTECKQEVLMEHDLAIRFFRKFWLGIFCLAFLFFHNSSQAVESPFEKKLSQALQQAKKIKGLQMDFTQEFYSNLRDQITTSQGVMKIKPPLSWSFEIKKPQNELYICNGIDFWKYNPDLKHAQHLNAKTLDKSAFVLLANPENMKTYYSVSPWENAKNSSPSLPEVQSDAPPAENAESMSIKLLPKGDNSQKVLYAILNVRKGFLKELRVVQNNGNRMRWVFSHQKNEKFENDSFTFQPPQGVAVDKN